MGYRVVSRFFDRARKVYVDPDAPCPVLDAVETKRLVAAGCLVVEDESAPANASRRRREVVPAPAAPAEPPAAGE